MKNPSPKSAATVILVRPDAKGGFELLMIKRPEKMEFLGGVYAFPGGTVKDDDCTKAISNRSRGLTPEDAQRLLGHPSSARLAFGYWIAAIRELFEEVGILLCIRERTQVSYGNNDCALDARLAEKRDALLSGSLTFLDLLSSEGLYCDTTSLHYLSHWRTPEVFSIRFDTRFYLAQLPAGHVPVFHSGEVATGLWVTPDRALELSRRGELPIIFPTFASILSLANFDSWTSLRAQFGFL